MFDCIHTVRFRGSSTGDVLELTEDQKELAYKMARLRLLDDPKVAARLQVLQNEAMAEVRQMVLAEWNARIGQRNS